MVAHRLTPYWIRGVIKTSRPRQNGRHFADDIFKCIFMNEIVWISINISLRFVPEGQINNIPSLVQKMAWRRPGDKPLSEPMMVQVGEAYVSLGLSELKRNYINCITFSFPG